MASFSMLWYVGHFVQWFYGTWRERGREREGEWNDTTKSVTLLELTIPFDTLLEEAAKRKEVKYHELVSRIKGSGYATTFLTIEVGSRGLPNISGFSQLRQIVGLSKTVTKSLMRETTRLAIIGSYKIWCSRNNINI